MEKQSLNGPCSMVSMDSMDSMAMLNHQRVIRNNFFQDPLIPALFYPAEPLKFEAETRPEFMEFPVWGRFSGT